MNLSENSIQFGAVLKLSTTLKGEARTAHKLYSKKNTIRNPLS